MDVDDDGFLDDLVQQQNREVLVESKLFFATKTGEISLLQVYWMISQPIFLHRMFAQSCHLE